MSNYLDKLHRKVAVAVRVFEDSRLSMLARLVFGELLLRFHNTADGRCDPSATTVGKGIGRHEKNVRIAIAELEEAGLIRSRRRGPTSSEYTFPGLGNLNDRAILSGHSGQDRAILSERPGEIMLEDRAILPDKPNKGTKKENLEAHSGKRLSDDWRPSQADIDFAKAYGLTGDQIEFEAEKFRNYWIAKAGEGAIKVDWGRTWQNWIIKTEKYGISSGRQSRSTGPNENDWDAHVRKYRESGKWLPALGPPPDFAGCRAPLSVLRGYGFSAPDAASA